MSGLQLSASVALGPTAFSLALGLEGAGLICDTCVAWAVLPWGGLGLEGILTKECMGLQPRLRVDTCSWNVNRKDQTAVPKIPPKDHH